MYSSEHGSSLRSRLALASLLVGFSSALTLTLVIHFSNGLHRELQSRYGNVAGALRFEFIILVIGSCSSAVGVIFGILGKGKKWLRLSGVALSSLSLLGWGFLLLGALI